MTACDTSPVPGTTTPGSSERRVHRAKLLQEQDGAKVFRFSYNQFRFGDVNPSEIDVNSPEKQYADTPLGRIAQLGERFFYEHVIAVLIPEGYVPDLDVRRPQVLIEAAIAEITGQDAEQLAVQIGTSGAARAPTAFPAVRP